MDIVISTSKLLQLEYESKSLPVTEIFQSDTDPCNLYRWHSDGMISKHLDGEAQHTVPLIGRNSSAHSSATALTLKLNLENPN